MNGLSRDLQTWMNDRFLSPILALNGGWEYWIQIDFPAYLDIMYSEQFDFQREIRVGNQRIDWIINSNIQDATNIAIEIKAQTKNYLTRDFMQAVQIDMNKLANLDGNYRRFMLCAIIDESAKESLESLEFQHLFTFGDGSGAYYRKAIQARR
jgi:hypothetical protein